MKRVCKALAVFAICAVLAPFVPFAAAYVAWREGDV